MEIIPTTDERNVIYPPKKILEKKVLKKSEWERLSRLLMSNNKFQFSLIFLDKIVSGRQYIDFAKEQPACIRRNIHISKSKAQSHSALQCKSQYLLIRGFSLGQESILWKTIKNTRANN